MVHVVKHAGGNVAHGDKDRSAETHDTSKHPSGKPAK